MTVSWLLFHLHQSAKCKPALAFFISLIVAFAGLLNTAATKPTRAPPAKLKKVKAGCLIFAAGKVQESCRPAKKVAILAMARGTFQIEGRDSVPE